jgi:Tfp pilus assembly protein FimT
MMLEMKPSRRSPTPTLRIVARRFSGRSLSVVLEERLRLARSRAIRQLVAAGSHRGNGEGVKCFESWYDDELGFDL